MSVTEHPVFIPSGGERLAGVLTVPGQDPLGLVLLLNGRWGARSLRYTWWVEIARHLSAELDLAVLRIDYAHLGDSTQHDATGGTEVLEQARAAVAFGLRATGTTRYATVGTCLGGRIGLQVAAEIPNCAAVVAMAPYVYPATRPRDVGRILAFLAKAGRLVRRLTHGYEPDERFGRWLGNAADSSDVLILTGIAANRWGDATVGVLQRLVENLPPERLARVTLRHRADVSLAGFPSSESHRYTFEQTVGWLGRAFADRDVAIDVP